MDEETPSEPVSKKPSAVPSWVTLGFVLGALFVTALPRRDRDGGASRGGGDGAGGGGSGGVAAGGSAAMPSGSGPVGTDGVGGGAGADGAGGGTTSAAGSAGAARRTASFTTIEAVFATWGQYASWTGDVTEVALWNAQDRAFTDCFEVIRSGENTYFRSIPRLTRPVLTRGIPDGSPLVFTESEEQRRAFLDAARKENAGFLLQGARATFGPHDVKPQP